MLQKIHVNANKVTKNKSMLLCVLKYVVMQRLSEFSNATMATSKTWTVVLSYAKFKNFMSAKVSLQAAPK